MILLKMPCRGKYFTKVNKLVSIVSAWLRSKFWVNWVNQFYRKNQPKKFPITLWFQSSKEPKKKTAITNFDIFVRTRSACSLGSFFKGNPNSNNYTAKWTPLQFKRLPVFLFDQIDHFRGCPEETEKMCKQTGHLERYDSLFSNNAKSWNIYCIISCLS